MAKKEKEGAADVAPTPEPKAAAKAAALVPMARDGATADVHPEEVEHMRDHGWRKA